MSVRGYVLRVVDTETEGRSLPDPLFVLARSPAQALRIGCYRLVRYGDHYAKVEVETLASGEPLQRRWRVNKKTYNLYMKRQFSRAEIAKPEKKV